MSASSRAEAHDVLKACIDPLGVKLVASKLGLSSSLLYKWCSDDEGVANDPLTRLDQLMRLTGDTAPLRWLAQGFDGAFVRNPEGRRPYPGPLEATPQMVQDFSELLKEVGVSLASDMQITPEEAARIRACWEDLKVATEEFVRACEAGRYNER